MLQIRGERKNCYAYVRLRSPLYICNMTLKQVVYSLKRRLDDSDAKSPLNFKYISMLSFMLSSIGSWPHRQFGRRRLDFILSMYNMLLIVVAMALPSLGATYIWYKRETISFFDAGHVLLCMFLEFLFLIHTQIHNISVIFTLYMACQMICGMCLFTFMPWYNNYNNGMFGPDRPANRTFEQAVYFYCFTEDVYTTIKGYWVLFVFNIPTAYNTSCGVVAFDLLISLIVFQIWGHLKILKHNLSSIIPKDGMYSPEENMRVREVLKEIIEHHKLIITFVDKCSNALSEELFVFYMMMQLLTCTCLLEVSSLSTDALAKYGSITLVVHQQLIQVSILFEMISAKSEQLIDAVYAMPWQCMDTSNRKTVMVLLQRTQTPITLKAAKMVPVGLQTMAAVLKTTFSYYMMLNAVAGER
ncbi:uncharacterized protein LOC134802754 isoform X3 [Cydia splendana]|uniref:uncharacterized protein LOC134802754 isoform X3 n=1 Tax=Cydia splendana TaxID=1100963 RepID=UPI00213428E1